MSGPKFLGFDTLALHAGQHPDRETGARATPIYQSTSFVFDDSDKASSLFDVARAGHVYSRISNPTVAVLEERVAALEGGVGAVCTASGMAAIHLGLTTITGAGGHIVASRALYGGTHNLLSYTLPRFGIETTFVDPQDPDAFAAAIRPETRVVFAETVANPRCEVLDIPRVSTIAHAAGVPLMIDATLTTPYLMQVLGLGADIVMHSLTKFMGGHGIALGGVLVDGGRFDWEASGRFPELSEPYAGFHGMDFVEEFGPAAYIMRARKEGLRDFGASLSPGNAFHLLQGLETLPMRMDRHVCNTAAIVKYLAGHTAVATVHHPDMPGHADHELAKKLLPKGAGAVFSFELAGGRPAGSAFIESLQLFSHLANVGDAKSLVIHPASTTHSRMNDADLLAAGVSPGLVRLSVGLENLDDLLADLSQALRRAEKATASASTGASERAASPHIMKIQLDGNTVFVGQGGVDWQPERRTLVLLHGAGMDRTVWVLLARYFARHGFNVITPDLPGHGATGGEPLTSIDAQASFLWRLLDHLNTEHGLPDSPVVLGGHSMGALAVAEAAGQRADKVAQLLLFGSGYPMPVAQPLLDAAKANDQSAIDMIAIFSHCYQSQLGHNPVAGISVLNSAMALLERSAPGVLYADLFACNDYTGLAEAAAAFGKGKTTVIVGDADRMTPMRMSRNLVDSFGAQLSVLSQCGHMVMSEQPEQTLQAVKQALLA